MGYAPNAIHHVWEEVHEAIPNTQLGGIYGTKPGYHNCRNDLPGSDYSVQKPDDKTGDGEAGAALDITFSDVDDEIRLMKRLMSAATSGDKRVWNLREFFGTVNGSSVTGYDPRGGYYVTSDNSHLWHIHFSFYRKFATSMATADDIIDVLLGQEQESDDDMNREDTEEMVANALRAYHLGGDHGVWTTEKYGKIIKNEDNGMGDRVSRLEKQANK
jgi:hypothetical protein